MSFSLSLSHDKLKFIQTGSMKLTTTRLCRRILGQGFAFPAGDIISP
jgi:hypothetical protein